MNRINGFSQDLKVVPNPEGVFDVIEKISGEVPFLEDALLSNGVLLNERVGIILPKASTVPFERIKTVDGELPYACIEDVIRPRGWSYNRPCSPQEGTCNLRGVDCIPFDNGFHYRKDLVEAILAFYPSAVWKTTRHGAIIACNGMPFGWVASTCALPQLKRSYYHV